MTGPTPGHEGPVLLVAQHTPARLDGEARQVAATPLLRPGHAHPGGPVCGECAAKIEHAADAVVAHLAASLHHAPPGEQLCPVEAERSAAWVLLLRIDAAGPAATRRALTHLAARLERTVCDHHRDALGAPVLTGLITPAAAAIPDGELLATFREGIGAAQTYLSTRAAARVADVPDLRDLAAIELAAVARLVGLVVLAMAAAAAQHHEGLGPGHQGPDVHGGDTVITADTIPGTDHPQ